MANIFEVTEDIKQFFRENYIPNDDDAMEKMVLSLKNRGCSQMQTVFLLINEAGMSFRNANRVIMNSPTWGGKPPFQSKSEGPD